MNLRILAYVFYFGACLVLGGLLLRSVVMAAGAIESAPMAVPEARRAMPCELLARALTEELWAWYLSDLRALGPKPLAREPLPGMLRVWEAARRDGAARCQDPLVRAKLEALEAMRRTLETNAYLLSQLAGEDIARLR